jgi:hypothetical protein
MMYREHLVMYGMYIAILCICKLRTLERVSVEADSVQTAR